MLRMITISPCLAESKHFLYYKHLFPIFIIITKHYPTPYKKLPAFPPFPAMFSTVSKANSVVLASFNFSSPNAFKLDKSRHLLFGKEQAADIAL